jgi:hypothetical protein
MTSVHLSPAKALQNLLLTFAEVIEVSYSMQSALFQAFQKPRISIIYAQLNNI